MGRPRPPYTGHQTGLLDPVTGMVIYLLGTLIIDTENVKCHRWLVWVSGVPLRARTSERFRSQSIGGGGHGRLRRRAAGSVLLVTTNHSDISEIIILIREKQVGLEITPGRRPFWAERRKLFPKRGSTGAGAPGLTRAHTPPGEGAALASRGSSALRPARLPCPRSGWGWSDVQFAGLGGLVTGNIYRCPL